MKDFVDKGAELLGVRTVFLSDAPKVIVTSDGGGGEKEVHVTSDFAATRITDAAGFAFDRAMAKPDFAHNIFVTPIFNLFTHFRFSSVHDRKFKIAKESDKRRGATGVNTHVRSQCAKLADNRRASAGFRRKGFFETERDGRELRTVLLDKTSEITILIAERPLAVGKSRRNIIKGLGDFRVNIDIFQVKNAIR